jgi:hypothetical protein
MTAAVLLGLAATLSAAPVDFAQVAADAGWLVHLDVDGLRQAALFQKAYHKLVEDQPNFAKQLDALHTLLAMDVRRDLHGITVYGKRLGAAEGVLLVHADLDPKALAAKAQWLPEHKIIAYGAYELHTWADADGKDPRRTLAGAFYRPTLAVFAPGVDELKAALDVLDGRSPRLAGDSPLACTVPPNTALLARAVRLADAELPFKSPLVTQSETIGIALGEHEGAWFGEARLTVQSAETAGQIRAILEGLRAMGELQADGDAEVKALLRRFRVQPADRTITVEFRAPVEAVWGLVEREWNKNKARRRPPADGPKQ